MTSPGRHTGAWETPDNLVLQRTGRGLAVLAFRPLSAGGVRQAWHRTSEVKVRAPGNRGTDLLARGAQARG